MLSIFSLTRYIALFFLFAQFSITNAAESETNSSPLSQTSSTSNLEAKAQENLQFFVAKNGNDAWSGTLGEPNINKTDGPFLTLDKAKNAIRLAKTISQTKSYSVFLREGVYFLEQSFTLESQDSGSKDYPIVYAAFNGEKVILSGGKTIPLNAFTTTTDLTLLKRLHPLSRGHVVQANLQALGINDLGNFPKQFKYKTAPELIFNEKRMTLARWPNNTWATIDKIIKPGSDSTGNEGGVFKYAGDRPSRWNADEGIWLHGYWRYDWYDDYIKIKSINDRKNTILLDAPHHYTLKKGNPSPRRYYALNIMEELDTQGEYYIDRESSLLFFWPPEKDKDARIVLSSLKDSLITLKEANHLILRDLILEASLGKGITIFEGENVRIQSCEIRNVNEMAILVAGGKNHQIEACDIHDTGQGGIAMRGGERKSLTPANHQAINNHIWKFATNKYTYSSAIQIYGVGNRAANNLIHDAPHQAISIGGNDHIIEYNIVHDVVLESDDSSAFYMGRNPSNRGNIVRYNFWHHIGTAMGHGTAAIYLDDGQGGVNIFGNIFLNSGQPGKGNFGTVFSNGGHDNVADNNIFIQSNRALGSVHWNDKKWKDKVLGNGENGWNWQDKFLKEVDITKPPFITRYPELKDLIDPKPNQIRINRAVRNVFVNVENVSSGNWDVDEKINWSTNEDPGFVDAENGNFLLSPDSKIFTKLPGFQPIPFEKIGLIENTLRPSVTKEIWEGNSKNPIKWLWNSIKKALQKE